MTDTFDPVQVEAGVRRWLERAVIGLNLCPFAKAVYVRDQVRIVVSDASTARALLEELGEPLLTTTLQLPGDEFPLTEGWEIQDRLEDHLDLILDGGPCGTAPTTVIDLTGTAPELIRAGLGSLDPFGL